MQIKSIPKRWDGRPVVAFVTLPTEAQGPDRYKGVVILETRTDLYSVTRLTASSVNSDVPWRGVPGDEVGGLSWNQAQSALQTRLQGPHR